MGPKKYHIDQFQWQLKQNKYNKEDLTAAGRKHYQEETRNNEKSEFNDSNNQSLANTINKINLKRRIISETAGSIEKIVGKKVLHNGRIKYLIKWKGWSKDNNTWIPLEKLNCPTLIDQFELHNQSEIRKSSTKAQFSYFQEFPSFNIRRPIKATMNMLLMSPTKENFSFVENKSNGDTNEFEHSKKVMSINDFTSKSNDGAEVHSSLNFTSSTQKEFTECAAKLFLDNQILTKEVCHKSELEEKEKVALGKYDNDMNISAYKSQLKSNSMFQPSVLSDLDLLVKGKSSNVMYNTNINDKSGVSITSTRINEDYKNYNIQSDVKKVEIKKNNNNNEKSLSKQLIYSPKYKVSGILKSPNKERIQFAKDDDMNHVDDNQIEKIIDRRFNDKGQTEYLCQWNTFDATTSWEPKESIIYKDLIQSFERKHRIRQSKIGHNTKKKDKDSLTKVKQSMLSRSVRWIKARLSKSLQFMIRSVYQRKLV